MADFGFGEGDVARDANTNVTTRTDRSMLMCETNEIRRIFDRRFRH